MLVTPLPGTSREHLQKALREQHEALVILQKSGASNAQGRFAEYLEWTAFAVRHLGRQISAADLDRLVLTPGYARLLSYVGTQRALNVLVSVEIEQRVNALAAARTALDAQVARWAPLGAFVVADTSVYIQHEKKLKELDLAALIDAEGDLAPVHLLVPIVVLDELDGLKNKGPTQHVKWRAGYTLAVFDEVFPKGTGARPLRPAKPRPDPIPTYAPTAEIVFDPPGHVRLPVNDDELVDRTLVIQALAGRTVMLVTFDTGQAMRARAAGLPVNKLNVPIEDEPGRAPAAGRRSRGAPPATAVPG